MSVSGLHALELHDIIITICNIWLGFNNKVMCDFFFFEKLVFFLDLRTFSVYNKVRYDLFVDWVLVHLNKSTSVILSDVQIAEYSLLCTLYLYIPTQS